MRVHSSTMWALLMAVAVSPAQAKNLSTNQLELCKWGSVVAGNAQQAKLSGTTLYSARNKVKTKKYSKPWMPKMAIGITEQTYLGKSKLRPSVIKKTYYDGCIKHELARK
ncbi:hypothetical protein [Pseudomonas poae]|uniref:Valyl-tRNA synthetase n=1 Tax=Pseudomonas poae TaxID=200451 RepID=A0A2S9EUP9_9PSED|nr:hypothetical protein [Pseudomonas poae]PRA33728.1 hypothetical protein CQZ97_00540 [Pseudomonas poae]PRC19682.1 hypothetical protein CQZ99_10065 [Pseudomonas poae]